MNNYNGLDAEEEQLTSKEYALLNTRWSGTIASVFCCLFCSLGLASTWISLQHGTSWEIAGNVVLNMFAIGLTANVIIDAINGWKAYSKYNRLLKQAIDAK